MQIKCFLQCLLQNQKPVKLSPQFMQIKCFLQCLLQNQKPQRSFIIHTLAEFA